MFSIEQLSDVSFVLFLFENKNEMKLLTILDIIQYRIMKEQYGLFEVML